MRTNSKSSFGQQVSCILQQVIIEIIIDVQQECHVDILQGKETVPLYYLALLHVLPHLSIHLSHLLTPIHSLPHHCLSCPKLFYLCKDTRVPSRLKEPDPCVVEVVNGYNLLTIMLHVNSRLLCLLAVKDCHRTQFLRLHRLIPFLIDAGWLYLMNQAFPLLLLLHLETA